MNKTLILGKVAYTSNQKRNGIGRREEKEIAGKETDNSNP